MKASTLTLPVTQPELVQILREHGVTSAFLFGSFARHEQKPDSDFDLLVHYKPGVSYFDHLALQRLLEVKTGRRVDLVSKIHPSFKQYIEPELVDLGV